MEVDLANDPEVHLNGVNGVAHEAPAEEPAATVTEINGVPAIVFAPADPADAGPTADSGSADAGPTADPGSADAGPTADPGSTDDPSAEAVDTVMLEGILESLLLASGQPVPLARLVEALDGHDRRAVVAALKALTERYEREQRGLRVVHVGGGWQLRSAPEHGPWVRRLLGGRPPRLSRPMLETLAIIAYRQPCTRAEIEAIRGVDADAVVSTLLERRLIRIQGRKEAPGRPLLYGTTRDFLEVFGLPDLAALPPLSDLGDGAELLAARDVPMAEQAPAAVPEPTEPRVAEQDGTGS